MEDPPAPGPREFATTQWSLVVAAKPGEASRSGAREALEKLCTAYWYPLYAFVRYRGYSPDEAQDLTQSFFARLIETGGFASADPERGRFRSYLLGAMKHFLTNEWHRARARKRGGGVKFLDLDALDPEARYALRPARSPDPDAGFDREWARETIARAMEKLRAESESRGKDELFEGLKGSLTGEDPPRAEIAARLGMSAGALKVAVHRLRKRYREILRAEIAETVADASEIDVEMRHLVAALRRE
jgi:RNA polymerase sigma factor (sigma-70 family)